MILTVSAYGNKFLYKLMTTQSDPTKSAAADGFRSQVMVYDGRQSFFADLARNQAQVYDGFDGADLTAMPLFSGRVGDIPVFKSFRPVAPSQCEGEIFDPGDTVDNSQRLYYSPNTDLSVEVVDAMPRIVEIVRPRMTINAFESKTEVTEFTRFKNVWLPSRLVKDKTTFYGPTVVGPMYVETCQLIDAKENHLDDSAFKIETYLKPGAFVQDLRKQVSAGGQPESFVDRGNTKFDVAERDAMLDQKDNALMLAQGKGPRRNSTGIFALLTLACGAGGVYLWRRAKSA
jgi:hypothetical protein